MNKTELKNLLLLKEKEYLSELVIMLLHKLDDDKMMDFTAKYINAKVVLSELNELDNKDFLEEIKKFCEACLDGQYYVEAYYDDYSDSYDDDELEDSYWAENFAKYFRLSAVHAHNGEFKIAYPALDALLGCINEAGFNEELLGTEQPLEYIKIDINDILEAFFESALKYHKDAILAYDKIFDTWLDFREYFTGDISVYITDLEAALFVLENNIKCLNFTASEKLYLLIKKIHESKGAEFDELAVSSKLVKGDPNYSLYLAQGYLNAEKWGKAAETALKYIDRVNTINENRSYYHTYDKNSVSYKLKVILVEAYENNGQLKEAYGAALDMFKLYKWFNLYKKARFLAEKIMNTSDFTDEIVNWLETRKTDTYEGADNKMLLRKILSFEGRWDKLIEIAPRNLKNIQWGAYSSDNSYEYLKYSVMSLIYACLGDSGIGIKDEDDDAGEETEIGIDYGLENLSELISKIKSDNNEGISDMLSPEKDPANQERYLSTAADMLKDMVQFHIDGAQRKSYTKAAYYAAIRKDLCEVRAVADDYVQTLMKEHNRRPAFKEEMRKVFGRI